MKNQEQLLTAVRGVAALGKVNNGIQRGDVRNISHTYLPDSAQYRYLVVAAENLEGMPPGVYVETNLTPELLAGHPFAREALGARVTMDLFDVIQDEQTTDRGGVILNSADFVSATGAAIFRLG